MIKKLSCPIICKLPNSTCMVYNINIKTKYT